MRLFEFGAGGGGAVVVECDANDVGAAADGAIFDVLLLVALGDVDGDDDLFAAGAAEVGGFVVHG